MCHENIDESIAVDIAHANAHVGLGLSHGIQGNPALKSLFLKFAILLIHKKTIGLGIICKENIHPAITIEIVASHAKPGSWVRGQP